MASHAKIGLESYLTFVIESDTIDPSLNGSARIYGYTYEGAGNHPLKHVSVSLLKDSVKIDQRLSNIRGQFFYQTLKPGKYELVTKADDMTETRSYILELKANQKLKVAFHIMHVMECVTKPIIYLYPEEKTGVELKLHFKGELTYTYPKYDKKWTVTAYPNGKIEMDGDQYNYLFWDGKMPRKSLRSNFEGEGAIVSGTNCETYLSKTLDDFGFNAQEKQDFMTYWVPQMIDYPRMFVRFYVNDAYDSKIGGITVSPNPDAILRVYMVVEPTTYQLCLPPKEQTFEKLNRTGFTLLEWGGTLIQPVQLEN
jgi:hypothetical protein